MDRGAAFELKIIHNWDEKKFKNKKDIDSDSDSAEEKIKQEILIE